MTDSNEIWEIFLTKLRATGSSLEEIENCTSQVFQGLLMELGFSALQCAKLQTMWSRKHSHAATIASANDGPCRVAVGESTAEYEEIKTRAASFCTFALVESARHHHGAYLHAAEISSAVRILAIDRVANPLLEEQFTSYRHKLSNTSTIPVLKWKWVSMLDVEKVARNGIAVTMPTSNASPSAAVSELNVDPLCPSGFVLYGDTAMSCVPPEQFETQAKLVAYDIILGNTKLLDEDDVKLLGHFSMQQCCQSLMDEGYDSIQVRRTDARLQDAFVIFHPHQVLPKYVVTFSVAQSGGGLEGPGLDPSMILRSADGSPLDVNQISKLKAEAHSQIPSSPHRAYTYYCQNHPTKRVEFWCVDEKRLVCSYCMYLQGYSQKNCILLEDAASREKEGLSNWVGVAEKFISEMGQVMVNFDAAMDRLTQDSADQSTSLGLQFSAIKEHIDVIQKKVEEDMKEISQEQMLQLQKTMTKVVSLVSDVEDLVVVAKTSIKTNNVVELLKAQETACQEWPSVKVEAYFVPRVKINVELVKELIDEKLESEMISGPVDLPEIIDVNNLHADVQSSQPSVGAPSSYDTQSATQ